MKTLLLLLTTLALAAGGCAVRGYLDFDVDLTLDVPSVAETPESQPAPRRPDNATRPVISARGAP